MKKSNISTLSFPSKLLKPIGDFLMNRLKSLRVNKKNIASEDPFNSDSRGLDYAAPDTEAEEQFGHARAMAIKDELNIKAKQIKRALERINSRKYGICEECNKMIDTDRLAVSPEATKCIKCKSKE